MNPAWWPLHSLRLRTPRLELRLPGESDLDALAALAAQGVHDPAEQPFTTPWTDASPQERARSTIQFQWRQWATWTPASWSLGLAVVCDGTVVGSQGVAAQDFAVLREVHTGSWLGLAHHGQGIGTEMRAAVLHLAFAGLGARHAISGAFFDNPASLAVSRKLGYRDDGIEWRVRRGRPAWLHRLRLDCPAWEQARSVPVSIEELAPCLPLFALAEPVT